NRGESESVYSIHRSVRKIVEEEKGRRWCCFYCPRKEGWRRDVMEVYNGTVYDPLTGSGAPGSSTADERRLVRLKWIAKSVLDKTLDSLVGNPVSSTGFVTFTTLTASMIARQSTVYGDSLQMRVEAAPDRRDVIWANLERTIRRRFIKSVVSIAVALFLTILVATVSFTVSVSISANNLKDAWNPFSVIADLVPYGEEGLAFVAPVIIMTIVICMPPILAFICKTIFRSERTLPGVHQHVFQRYFLLLYYNLLVVLILTGSLTSSISSYVNEQTPNKAFADLGFSLARISNFYIDYVVIKTGVGLSLELTRFSAFFQAGVKALFSDDLTAQQREKMVIGCRSITRSGGWYYGRFLAEHCLVFVLIFTYSVIAPLILLFGSVFFLLASVVYKRQLLWCYEPELNCGGEFWPQCFRRVIYGVVTSQIALICMLCFLENVTMAGFVFPLIPVTLLYSKYIQRIYGRSARSLPLNVALMVDRGREVEEGDVSDRLRDAYTQPSLVSESEPIYRGDGGYDGNVNFFCGCCCPLNMQGEGEGREEESMRGTASIMEPYVALPRRQTRGLSWGRKYSANV
ncbi:hypothetical protein TrRE_jg4043, partial [Triparma retinervis]